MPTMVVVSTNELKVELEGEVDLNSSAAVGAVRGTGLSCTKTGTGTYSVVYNGPGNLKLYEILERQADLVGSPTGAFWAKITSVSQTANSGGEANDPITILISTLNNAATPAATDVTAACTMTFGLVFRGGRNPQSSPL